MGIAVTQRPAASGGALRPVAVAVGFMLVGLLLGAAAKAWDESGWSWAADAGTYPALWVGVLAACAAPARSAAPAAVRAASLFLGVDAGYYTWAAMVLHFPVGRLPLLWGLLAVTLAPLVAAMVWWASRARGVVAGAVLATCAGAALSDGSVRRAWLDLATMAPGEPWRPAQAALVLAVAVLVTVVVPRQASTRVWAVVLAIPMSAVALYAVDALYARVVPF